MLHLFGDDEFTWTGLIWGIGSLRRGKTLDIKWSIAAANPAMDIAIIQSGTKFIRDIGGAETAYEVIKLLQAK